MTARSAFSTMGKRLLRCDHFLRIEGYSYCNIPRRFALIANITKWWLFCGATMDYLSKRQNPVQNGNLPELNAMLCAVVHEFGEEWLTTHGDNPLQILWSRKDALGTNELLLFGNAIIKGQAADPNWVKRHVDVIQSPDSNNRQGAFFELLAMSMFACDGVQILPARKNNPGYDGTIILNGGASIQVSLKSHGLSAHQRLFNERSSEIETILVSLIGQRGINAVRVVAAATRYPGEMDWSFLKENLIIVVDSLGTNSSQPIILSDTWRVSVEHIEQGRVPFSSKFTSYTFHALSPFHKNESKNLLDKIDQACTNFSKCDEKTNPKTIRVVFIHLPRSVSFALCQKTVRQYFMDSGNTPIAGILLYQTCVSTAVETNTSSINHCVDFITGPRYQRWVNHCTIAGPPIQMNVLIGTVSTEPPQLALNKGEEYVIVDSMYTYQKGNLYELYTADDFNCGAAHIKNLGSGIFTHAVLNLTGQGEFVMKGIFPPAKELLLL